MAKDKATNEEQPTHIDTPAGIFTTSGNWFHTSTKALQKYAPKLFERTTVKDVLKDAETWIRTTDGLTILFFFVLMLTTSIQFATVASLIFLPFWYINKSAFTYPGVTKILKTLDIEPVILAIAVGALSVLGINEQYYDLFIGFLVFFLFKFGWYRKLVDRLYHKWKKKSITLNDRLLRMIIIRYAQAEGENVAEVDKMEKDFLKLINQKIESRKKNKKKS